MRRLRKWLLILGALVLVLAAGIVLTWVFFGPAIARSIIVRNLNALGIERVALTVERVGLQRVELSGIALGSETWLAIRTATATYGPFDLVRGRLKTLTLEDAKWAIRADEDGVDWGFPGQGGDEGAAVPDLPFDTIEIVRAIAMIDRGRESVPFEIEGSIQRQRAHHLTLELKLSGAGMSLALDGEAAGEESLDVLRVDGAAREVSVPQELRPFVPEILHDFVAEKLEFSYDSEGADEASMRAAAIRFGDFEFRGISAAIPRSNARPLLAQSFAEAAPDQFATTRFSIEGARWRDHVVKGGDGMVTLAGDRLSGEAWWRPTDEVEMTVRLNGVLAGDSPHATLLFSSAPFQIVAGSETSLQITGTSDWSISGLFALDALVGFGEGAPDPHILITAEDGAVSRVDGTIALGGIDGSIELDRITPLLTSGVQRVTVESGRLGELTVTGGEIEVDARGDGLVRFERFIASMGEYGVFQAAPLSIDPAAPKVETTITARNMSLAPWLKLIAEDRVRGEGLLAGEIHVEWDSAKPTRFTIEDSMLAAQPSRGWLTISDESDLRELLEKSDARFADQEFMDTVGDRIVAAIQDFDFTSLRIEFEETVLGTEFHIVTQGRGRQGEDAQEIGSLTLNIHAPFRVLYWAVMEAERLQQFFDSE